MCYLTSQAKVHQSYISQRNRHKCNVSTCWRTPPAVKHLFPSPEHLLYQLDPPPTSSIHLSTWSSSKESVKQTKIMMITLKIILRIISACNLLDPQLPGLTPEHVALVAATGLLMLFAFSYLTSETSRPIRQSRCLLDSGDIIFTTFLHWKYSRFYQIDQISRCW